MNKNQRYIVHQYHRWTKCDHRLALFRWFRCFLESIIDVHREKESPYDHYVAYFYTCMLLIDTPMYDDSIFGDFRIDVECQYVTEVARFVLNTIDAYDSGTLPKYQCKHVQIDETNNKVHKIPKNGKRK